MSTTGGPGDVSTGPTPAPYRIRPAVPEDGEGVAALFVQCVGGQAAEHRQGFEREMAGAGENNLVLVAEAGSQIIGFGRARHVEHPSPPAANAGPAGWYLLGVDVLPVHRQQGVGAALTRARLGWIAERAAEAFYFTAEENRASIALHDRFGFREVSRDVVYPGALGSSAGRVLYRVALQGRTGEGETDEAICP